MKTLFVLFTIILGATTAEVCQTAAPAAPQKATIHVYRAKAKMKGILLHPAIYSDGTEIKRLSAGKFLVASLPPGKHMISAGRSEVGQLVDMEPGKHYYFRLGHKNMFAVGLSGVQPITISVVSEEEAKSEMAGLKEQR